MTTFGQVTAYNGLTHTATIAYERHDACQQCGACGAGARPGSIDLQADCTVGDWVRLDFPERRFVQASTLAYGLPLAGFLAGLALGIWLFQSEVGVALSALVGLALAFLFLWINERRIRGRGDWSVRVTGVYAEKPSEENMACPGRMP